LEEELKLKLSETARVVKQKDEEQGALIKKYKVDPISSILGRETQLGEGENEPQP
jgi:hypothetical protein